MYGFGPHTEFRSLPISEHTAAANTRVHVTIMLETERAFTRLDEIAAVPGIDALTIGPTDLAQDLGVLGTPAQRQVLHEHRRRLVTAARRNGKAVAMLTDSAEGVRQMIALGATIINYRPTPRCCGRGTPRPSRRFAARGPRARSSRAEAGAAPSGAANG